MRKYLFFKRVQIIALTVVIILAIIIFFFNENLGRTIGNAIAELEAACIIIMLVAYFLTLNYKKKINNDK